MLTDLRIISRRDYDLALANVATYQYPELADRSWNTLPPLTDVKAVCDALIKEGERGNYCSIGNHWSKGDNAGHPTDCPVTTARNLLSQLGGG